MSVTVSPDLIKDIRRYGAFDISACFNCGNCTAVCPLSTENGAFPRRLIRLGQIGAREQLLASPEAWLCYYCGECSETCPRQAEPGEYMAALRRYATAAAEPTGLARLMFHSVGAMALISVLVAIVLGAFLATSRVGANPSTWIFHSVSYQVIHLAGLAVMVLCIGILLAGLVSITRRMLGSEPAASLKARRTALWRTVVEVATMSRHREMTTDSPAQPWYQRAAWIHIGIMGGFLGLLAATTLDFVFLEILPLGLHTFWPARILGTASGLVMLWGVLSEIQRRLAGAEKNVAQSQAADWWPLFFLLVLAATGFWLEIAVTLHIVSPVNDGVMLVHSAMAMEFVLLLAFTKMSHIFYRPVALYTYFLREERTAEAST